MTDAALTLISANYAQIMPRIVPLATRAMFPDDGLIAQEQREWT